MTGNLDEGSFGSITFLGQPATPLTSTTCYDQEEREFQYEMLSRAVFGAFSELCSVRKQEDAFSRAILGERTGKDKTGVSKLLKGPANWTLRTMSDFANSLDADVTVLLSDRKCSGRYFDHTGMHQSWDQGLTLNGNACSSYVQNGTSMKSIQHAPARTGSVRNFVPDGTL